MEKITLRTIDRPNNLEKIRKKSADTVSHTHNKEYKTGLMRVYGLTIAKIAAGFGLSSAVRSELLLVGIEGPVLGATGASAVKGIKIEKAA